MSYKKEKKADRKKVLLIIVCVFVASVVIFGATLGIVLGVRNAKATVRFNGVRISEGEAYFLLTKYKRDFIIEYGGHDSESFFNSKYRIGIIATRMRHSFISFENLFFKYHF